VSNLAQISIIELSMVAAERHHRPARSFALSTKQKLRHQGCKAHWASL
jgi:hypothetical protein